MAKFKSKKLKLKYNGRVYVNSLANKHYINKFATV